MSHALASWIGVSGGSAVGAALALALLLGLRHATDPDHLTAVATLVVSDVDTGASRAGRLGLAWGFGHGVTLFLFGLPLILLGRALPDGIHQAAEVAVGAVIVVLAARLLLRWRRGRFHTHAHRHQGIRHAHPHFHELNHPAEHAAPAEHEHDHDHAERLDRSPAAAFGVGLIHGVGGSAGAGVLLLAAVADSTTAIPALAAFALATALSMAVVSAGVGQLLATGSIASRHMERVVPAFGVAGLCVGVWYALGALGLVPLWY